MGAALTTPLAQSGGPARTRGLRRGRVGGPCPPPATVEIPVALTALTRPQMLGLLARAYDADVAVGRRLSRYDLQAFKSCWALLCHLHRLGQAAPSSAHIATSSVQLVSGMAAAIPAWKANQGPGGKRTGGARFAMRDRHHSWLRRNLALLARAGLIELYAGLNDELEHLRTEVMLLDPPLLSEVELRAARAQHARWTAKYGRELATATSTGVRSLRGLRLALSPAQRKRPAVERCKMLAQARRASANQALYLSQTAHPSGSALPSAAAPSSTAYGGEDNTALSHPKRLSSTVDLCASKTQARAANRSGPQDPDAENGHSCFVGATNAHSTRATPASQTETTPACGEGSAVAGVLSPQGPSIGELLAQQEVSREHCFELLIEQMQVRHDELGTWELGRGWPAWRVLEAWAVARHGAQTVAAASSVRELAGFLGPGWPERLARVLARYERYQHTRPVDWPAGAWAAFLHAGAVWPAELAIGTIAALDALTMRMRALATHQDSARARSQARRAARRRLPDSRVTWRPQEPRFPLWHTDPDTYTAFNAPEPSEAERRAVQRDADRLADLPVPGWADGRREAAERNHDLAAPKRPAGRAADRAPFTEPGRPEPLTPNERDLRELANRLRLDIRGLRNVPAEVREELLQQARERRHTARQLEDVRLQLDAALGASLDESRLQRLAELEQTSVHAIQRLSEPERQALWRLHRGRGGADC